MNPAVENVILGIIANGLTALIGYLGREGAKILGHKDDLRRLLEKDTSLGPILQKAAASVAKAEKFDDTHQADKLRLFLISPDVDAIVRQIYGSQLIPDQIGIHLESLRAEFRASLSLHLGTPEEGLRVFSEDLFKAVLMGCERALAISIDKGVLSAHEGKSASRHRMILDELTTIKKNLTFLTAPHKPDLEAILEFEKKYRQQAASRHAQIIPPHFDAARKLPIADIYVSPRIITSPKEKGEEPEALRMVDFLLATYRAVLLGNPGGGKSTFASKLCFDLATRYSERLFAGRQVTPILIVLRDYGAEKKARSCSILQFIEATANSKYQVQPPPGAFEYLLLNGRAVVILDGLDELLDTSYRQEVSSDVESFCTLYPSVPVLVTSREVGYEQAPLDQKTFAISRLALFDEDEVREYVTKWFAVDTDLTPEQQQQKAAAFFEESRIVPDLRSNPLMLALMCNIYRGESYIPRNRPDVYEKCALMLFERWDKSRGIYVPLPFEAHIRPAMMYLANWIYMNEPLQGGVTEKNLIAKATEYLCPRRFEDRDEAERAARGFIEFCRGRAWVFTDTGTTREGERLYQFTHRTFLEYFTAAHLVRIHPTPDRLGEVLLPKIAKREWDVVAQLAFQLQNKNVEGAGDELLSELIKQARENEVDQGWNLLSFAARCLEFMVPSPKLIRDITTACVVRCIAWGFKGSRQEKSLERRFGHREHSEPNELLGGLLSAATENRVAVAGSLEKLLIERVNSGSEREALLALEIGLHLTLPLHHGTRGRVPQREVFDFWTNVSDRVFDACSGRIEALCPKHFRPCVDTFWRGTVRIANLTKWHGVEALFRQCSYSVFPSTWSWAPGESLIYTMLSAPYLPERWRSLENRINDLKEAGHILLSSRPPWFRGGQFALTALRPWVLDEDRFRSETRGERLSLDSDALFGAFALFAAMLESSGKRKELVKSIKESRLPFFDSMRCIFLARFEQVENDNVQAEMDRCGLTTEQQAFAWRWVRKEINLVQRGKDKKARKDLSEEED